jgi:hypothetical protein
MIVTHIRQNPRPARKAGGLGRRRRRRLRAFHHAHRQRVFGTRSETRSPGVEVFHFSWDDIPGEGHYCLLARRNEDGSPLSFTSLGTAVRNDNDLIWRNVNIIDRGGDIDDSAGGFRMTGHRNFRDTYLVLEAAPKKDSDIRTASQVAADSAPETAMELGAGDTVLGGVTFTLKVPVEK